ncbi:MAG: acyltransferase family protein [Acidimicrobiales bacterium]
MNLRGRHVPALDGVRALAIAGVLAYHLGVSWASGGFLGVDLFFVLSGFLITSLLVEEQLTVGTIALRAFWGRRARRLLPGLLLMLVGLGAFLALAGPGPLVDLHTVRSDAIATLLYVANWHQLFADQSYFSQFSAPSPLEHTWSLAIEEQFYVVWPLVVLALFQVSRKKWRSNGVVVALGGAAASAAWMAWLASRGASADRLYYGTDTRAFDLLIGAGLGYLIAGRPQPSRRARRLLAIGGPAGLLVMAPFWWRAGANAGVPGRGMFEWGFLACACAAALVVADVRQGAPSLLGKLLARGPLVFVGRISYELYLWHWPVICELTPLRLGFGGIALDAVRISVIFVLAILSYFLVGAPIRRWGFRGWPTPLRMLVVPAGMLAASLVMVLGTIPAAAAAPVAAVAAGPGVPGAGHMSGGPIRLARSPSRTHPLRVILFGDSVMRDNAPAISAALSSTGDVVVDDAGFDGWGLTTDRSWRQGVPRQIEQDHAQLVIAMWSFDDNFLVSHPRSYRRSLSQFVRLVVAQRGVAGLIFQQFPPLGPLPLLDPTAVVKATAARQAANRAWNRLALSLVALRPSKVMYLPLGPAVERAGRFAFWLPPGDRWALPPRRWMRVRSLDAVHFCPPGAARYAAALTADLTTLYHLPPPTSGWSTGSWTRDRRYNEPPGNCPNDHPS